MRYVDSVLEDGERVIYRAKVHWIVYWPFFLGLAAVFTALWFARGREDQVGITIITVLFALPVLPVSALIPWIKRRSTELAVTNRRVIAKLGFIRRRTWEINSSKVEGVEVDQSVLGRIFDFGTLTVKGTGTGTAPINGIDEPIEFRRHLSAL